MDKEAGVAYIDSMLWLPREMVDIRTTKASLTFTPLSTHGEPRPIKAWHETTTHLAVPLYYYGNIYHPDFRRRFLDAKIPLRDLRPRSWETINVFSRVKLDALRSDNLQHRAFDILLRAEAGILVLHCGVGKTVITLHAAAHFRHPFLIIVDNKGLVYQWKGEIEKFLFTDHGKPPKVGVVEGGRAQWDRPIVIAVINTVAKHYHDMPEDIRNRFFTVIYDEGEILGAREMGKAAAMFTGRRWCLSATPHRADGLEEMYYKHIGQPLLTHLKQDLKPLFYFYKTKTAIGEDDPYYRAHVAPGGVVDVTSLFGYLGSRLNRTLEIAAIIQAGMKARRKILVLSRQLEVLYSLKRYLPDEAFIHGGTPGFAREEAIRKCDIILSQMRLGEKALNKPDLDMIVLCHPIKRRETLQQIMGRELRPRPNKSQPVFVIVEDQVGPCLGMCKKLKKMITTWPADEGGPYGWRYLNLNKPDTGEEDATRGADAGG